MNVTKPRSELALEGWRTAGRFADVLQAEVKARRNPVVARIVSWFNLCRLAQDVEEQMLLGSRATPEDLQLQRSLLSQAIAVGEGLLLEGVDAGALQPLGITIESIEAKVQSLRITFDQWHAEINPARQEAILREVFGAER